MATAEGKSSAGSAVGWDANSPAELWQFAEQWLFRHVLTWDAGLQLAFILAAGGLALMLNRPLARLVNRIFEGLPETSRTQRLQHATDALILPIAMVLVFWFINVIATALGFSGNLLRIATNLLGAWVAIRLASNFIASTYWARAFAVTAWAIATLSILHLLEPTVALLDGFAFTAGQTRVSAFIVLKGALVAGVMLWLAFALSRMLQGRIQQVPNLTPSVQVLISQAVKFALIVIALVAALNTVGIDLTAFAVFSGAIGVGVGFGLQKIVSNLISGIILLLDRSIKPGDVIEVGGTYGRVNSLGARYASVVTRDGMEHLIPNEELIVNQVVNWSFSTRNVRIRLPVGVSYEADVEQAMALMIEAMEETARVLKEPPPNCLLTGFGDSSVDLEGRFWIGDPEGGMANVRSQVLLKIWHKFKDAGVEIPYPQRDLHLRQPARVEVSLTPSDST